MRLIDTDKLLEYMDGLVSFSYERDKIMVYSIVKRMPTIDAVEVVRCKDCMHKYVTGYTTQYYVCDFMDAQFDENGYCSHGERKEQCD